jgi:DNA-binding YbaB/EbfC family protein
MADLSQILQLSQQMQGRLQQMQADLADRQVEATAGGGMVRVKADGRGQIRELEIDPQVFEGRDADLLADLILAAVAEAQRRAAEAAQAEMRKTPGLSFPPGL